MTTRGWRLRRLLEIAIALCLLGLVEVTGAAAAAGPAPAMDGHAASPSTSPTPAPTPTASPAPRPPAALTPPTPRANPPATLENRLVGPGMNVGVGLYTDCTGKAPLSHAAAAIDDCIGWAVYFVGHDPGVFTSLFGYPVGTRITYYSASGSPQVYVVMGHQDVPGGVAPHPPADAAAQFQTCFPTTHAEIRVLYAAAGTSRA